MKAVLNMYCSKRLISELTLQVKVSTDSKASSSKPINVSLHMSFSSYMAREKDNE